MLKASDLAEDAYAVAAKSRIAFYDALLKENRNSRTFKCKSCSFQIDADLNASRNIATFSRSDRSRLSVNQPIVAG